MAKKDLSISEMKQLQYDLLEKHKDEWGQRGPIDAKNHILSMVEELGESISSIKKKGINQIMEDQGVRARFIEEFTDVMTYYVEALNRLQISPEEFSNAYIEKHNYNMNRDYNKDNSRKYNNTTLEDN